MSARQRRKTEENSSGRKHPVFVDFLSLFRVAERYEENKMSPNNLGIIFGPTLIHPPISNDVSMSCLVDSGYQSQLVEFLIVNYEKVFGMDDLPLAGLHERDNSLREARIQEVPSSNARELDNSYEVGGTGGKVGNVSK